MAIWTVPANYTLFLWDVVGGVLRATSAAVDIEFRTRSSAVDSPFQTKLVFPINSQGLTVYDYEYKAPLVIPAQTDVKVSATPSVNNTVIIGQFEGVCIHDNYIGTFREALSIDG